MVSKRLQLLFLFLSSGSVLIKASESPCQVQDIFRIKVPRRFKKQYTYLEEKEAAQGIAQRPKRSAEYEDNRYTEERDIYKNADEYRIENNWDVMKQVWTYRCTKQEVLDRLILYFFSTDRILQAVQVHEFNSTGYVSLVQTYKKGTVASTYTGHLLNAAQPFYIQKKVKC